jgi:hypothetical protein
MKNSVSKLSRVDRVREALRENDTIGSIAEIQNIKGILYVNWRVRPTTGQLAAVVSAWHAQSEVLSNHYLNGQALVLDVGGDNPYGEPAV